MVMLVDFAILVTIREFLRTILTNPFKELYTRYFNFEILILNGL